MPESSSSSSAAQARRTFWQRRIRDPIVAQLTQGITPEKIALSLAVGSAFGLFPILGAATIMCIIVAAALRLNQPIVQLINQALWPIHLPVIYGYIMLGQAIFGGQPLDLNRHRLHDLLWSNPKLFFHQFGLAMLYALVAWSVLAPFYITLVYFLALPITRRVAALKRKTETADMNDSPPPVP